MDVSCCYRSIACCDCDLIQVRNDVPGGIEFLNRSPLMLVTFKQPLIIYFAGGDPVHIAEPIASAGASGLHVRDR
jgi:hypothetical protein